MGCASSKPSSKSKKSKDSADVDKENHHKKQKNQNGKSSIPKSESGKSGHLDAGSSSLDAPIRLDKQLADELGQQQSRVVDFLVRAVSKDFALDLVKNSKQTGVKSDDAAGRVVQENYDLTTDVASKAIALLKTTQSPDSNITTYRQLNDRLKTSQYLCKTQTHKNRLCDLTVNKIKESVDLINQESSASGLLDFLAKYDQDQQLTPPQTPTTVTSSSPSHENAVLLSRAQANELARILFLSNRARPVVHASPKVKDAYYVNKQLTDNTEITVSKKEIDDILHKFDEPFTFQIKNLTYYDSPMITASPTRDSQPSASVNLLNELTQEQSLSSPHSDTSFTQVTAEVVDNVNHNDTTIEYEITTGENNNNNSNNEAHNQVDDNKNIKVEGDEEDDADLALATVAVMSALAASSSADENNNQANNELFSDEDFAKTTIVNTTITTTTTTTTITKESNDEPDQVVTREETKQIVEVQHHDDHQKPNDDETQQEQQQEAEEDVLDPILKQSLLDDRFYNNHSFKTEPPVNGQGLNDAATEIQAAQRAHAARQVADSLIDQIAEKAATTIQATYRGYKTRKEIRPVLAGKRAKSVEYHESVRIVEVVSTPQSTSVVDESNNSQIESQQPEIVATTSTVTSTTTTTITTTSLTDYTPETSTTTNPDGTNEPIEESNKAATKIQATYRGFRTRKHLKELKK